MKRSACFCGIGRTILVAAVAVLAVFLGGSAHAADCYWTHDPSAPGDWLDPSNWDPSSPGESDNGYIDNGGTASIATRDINVGSIFAGGRDAAGFVTQSGGTSTVGRLLYLGKEHGGTGRYDLSGGLLVVQDWDRGVIVGENGNGQFVQTGGTHLVADHGRLRVGYCGGTGTYTLGGGLLTAYGEQVGGVGSGSGSFAQFGGTNIARSSLEIASSDSATGTYALSDGSFATPSLTVGRSGNGSFLQSGGLAGVEENLILGQEPRGTGTYVLSGGSLSAASGMIGQQGHGVYRQSDGWASFGAMRVGGTVGGTGSVELSGGQLYSGYAYVGHGGTGEFHQTGGTHQPARLTLGGEAAGTGRYVLDDGLLRCESYGLVIGEAGRGEFIQNGGSVLMTRTKYGVLLGHQAGAEGTYVLSDGVLTLVQWPNLFVGYYGTGRFVQTGGLVTFPWDGSTLLGFKPGSFGEYRIEGGTTGAVTVGQEGSGRFTQLGGYVGGATVASVSGSEGLYTLYDGYVGGDVDAGRGGRGTFIQMGGTVKAGWCVTLGRNVTGTGRYELQAGLLSSYMSWVGYRGTGEFIQTGGKFAMGDGETALGVLAGSSGTYRLSGGTLLAIGGATIGKSGEGLFVQEGGYHRVNIRALALGATPGSSGRYVLAGGTLRVAGGFFEGEIVGDGGSGQFMQLGGTHAAPRLQIGNAPTSTGLYTLAGGELASTNVLVTDRGEFLQTGGRHTAQEVVVGGRYALSGGQLDANALTVSNEFILGRWADLSAHDLSFGNSGAHSPVFHAEPFSTIHMIGAGGSMRNYSTDPSGLADLVQVWMMFEGSGNDISLGSFEVAGKDLGPVPAGYDNNFALGVLELGGTGFNRTFTLRNVFDNHPDWVDGEALYVDVLMIHQGVLLNPAGLGLYYRNHEANVKRFFVADINLDGQVDGGDVALMNSHWWRPDGMARREEGDLNGDGWVDGGDIALLGSTWGERTEDYIVPLLSPPPGDVPLPEPAAMLVLALGGAALTARRRIGQ